MALIPTISKNFLGSNVSATEGKRRGTTKVQTEPLDSSNFYFYMSQFEMFWKLHMIKGHDEFYHGQLWIKLVLHI